MAKYFLHIKVFSRGKGSRVTRAAAYRAGERIRDERTSEVYNHSNRDDVLHKEIVLASQFAGRTAPASPDGYKKFGCAELTAFASTGVKSGAGSGEGAIQPLAAAADFRRTYARSTTLFCDSEARLRAATYTCFLSADLLRTNSDSGVDLTAASWFA